MLSGFVVVSVVLAAPVYIDGDATCPGAGTNDDPYCSLGDAVVQHELEPGDELLVRDAAEPYDGERVEIVASGTDGSPLVLAPDEGHSPIIQHAIRFSGGSSHWVVRDLTFDGSVATNLRAVEFSAGSSTITDVRVENLDIRDWGAANNNGSVSYAAAIALNAGEEGDFTDAVIRGNRITDGKGGGISTSRVDGIAVENNTIDGLSCAAGIYDADAAVVGIYAGRARDARIRFNSVRELDASDCAVSGDETARVVGVLLQSNDDTEIASNWVVDIGMGAGNGGIGILTAQDTDDPWAHHNVIVDAEECGLCDDFTYSAGGSRTLFEHNTVVRGQIGVAVYYPLELVLRDNVITGASDFAVRMFRTPINQNDPTELSWTLERNLYDAESGLLRLEYSNDFDLTGWQDACDCDEGSVEGPAELGVGSQDFTPNVSSPAVDLGDETAREPFNGAAPDAGALEGPEIVSATVREVEPDRVLVVFGSGGTPPMQVDGGCAGFVVAVDREPVSMVACESTGGAITIRLDADVLAGQAVTLSYEGPWVRDSSRLGGVLDAVLQPQEIEVTNASRRVGGSGSSSGTDGGSADDSGDASSSSTTADPVAGSTSIEPEDAGSSGDGAARGGFPEAQGCAIGSSPRGRDEVLWLFFACWGLLGRRRPSSAVL